MVQTIGQSREALPWCSVDAFTNLESLAVGYATDSTFISAIDRTITPRLKILDLRRWRTEHLENITRSFSRSLTHIWTLMCALIPPTLSLRSNVVKVRLEVGRRHLLPHIQMYEVDVCKFGQGWGIDLANIITLIVSTLLRSSLIVKSSFRPSENSRWQHFPWSVGADSRPLL
jgi:hypothetical protein